MPRQAWECFRLLPRGLHFSLPVLVRGPDLLVSSVPLWSLSYT